MTFSKRSFLVIAALAAISSASFAGTITTLAAPVAPVSPFAIVFDTSTNTFAATDGLFSGTETSTVYAGDTNNLLGGLTFVYSVTNDVSSADAFDRVTLSGFAGFNITAGYITGTGNVPLDVTVNTDGTIGFDFADILGDNSINQGQSSVDLVIRTDAPFDTANTISIIDGGTGSAASFGPAPGGGGGTPEPASLGIMAVGGLALLRRRRSR